ncbi:MAG TPA: PilZ domain-containing protein [Nocardioides sp.]|nr:PilZ domain-containing protein [Nocardioides sp.]
MSTPRPASTAAEVHPALLQAVALTLRPTVGEPVDVETRVLDVEPYGDGGTALVVACPDGLDPDEHHFDASVTWTYPLGRMVCAVSTRPALRHYGRVWLLRPSAAPTRLQQRTFFRARVAVPVALTWPLVEDADDRTDGEEDTTPPSSLLGVAVDLSEGGVLAATQGPVPAPGALVEVTLRIDGDNLAQSGRVVRHVRFAGGGVGVAVSFVDPAVHGDRIRRVVFETERRRHRPR